MAIYKSANVVVTAPTGENIGKIVAATPTLEDETLSLAFGYVKDGDTAIVGAAVVLVEITTEGGAEANTAIAYTDAEGRFGIPYEFAATGKTYRLDVYTPNPLIP